MLRQWAWVVEYDAVWVVDGQALTGHVGGAVVVRGQPAQRVGAHGAHVLLDVGVGHHFVLLPLAGVLQGVRSADHRWAEVPAN